MEEWPPFNAFCISASQYPGDVDIEEYMVGPKISFVCLLAAAPLSASPEEPRLAL